MAIEEESDPEDYIDKEINRKIALKRTETVKTVVKECINENDDILFKIKRRARAEQEAMKKFKVDKENTDYNEQRFIEDSNANIQLTSAHTDNVDNRLANVSEKIKTKSSKCKDELPDLEAADVAAAAVLIQSAFKGFKVRKELDEMKAFHRNMSQPICEEHSPKPQHKRRQNSYMEAVCSPPDSFADEPVKRSWKTRQESYNEAINQQEDNSKSEDWKMRQNSYLQAIGSSLDVQPQKQEIDTEQAKSTNRNIRQDSYQKAVTSVSPNTSISEDSKKESKFKKRQDSYQQAVDSLSEKSKSTSEPAYKKRQSSYQKAMSDNSTISENQKNIKNNKNRDKKDSSSKEEKQKKQRDSKNQDPKLGGKLKKEKSTEKKKSKSPRRIPESYQRPPSSSEEEDKSTSQKRSHKPRGVAKKQVEKLKSSDSKSAPIISSFAAAADVVAAAIRIQLAWRGYRARCEIREHHHSLDIEEQTADLSRRRGQKNKTEKKKGEPRGAWADVVNSCITIQRAYRKYRRNKILREIGVDDCEKAEDAIVKIQAHFKGFQIRKTKTENTEKEMNLEKTKKASSKKVIDKNHHKKVSKPKVNLGVQPRKRPLRTETYVVEDPYIKKTQAPDDDMPDLNLQEVADATVKIQAAYRGFKARQHIKKRSTGDVIFSVLTIQRAFKRYKARKARRESLPDINDTDIQKATITIQSAYRGFKTRKEMKKKSAMDVVSACMTIQRAFKRYKAREAIKKEEIKAKQAAVERAKKEAARAKEIKDKPHPKEPMTSYKRRQRHDSQLQTPRERGAVKANEEELKIKKEAVTYFGNLVPGEQGQVAISKKTHIPSPLAAKEPKKITSTVKTGKVPLLKDDLPDLRDKDVQNSAVLIQAAFRGYQTRKKKRSMADVIHSALVIQSAFRRYKARKALREKDSDLPDLKADDVVAASIKIQAAYKGFKTRKLMKKERKDDLPDLNAADVAQAALKIQSVYKGFRTRKMMKKHQEVLPGANLGEVTDATVKLQSAFRGYKARRQLKEKEDLPDLNAADVAAAAIKGRVEI